MSTIEEFKKKYKISSRKEEEEEKVSSSPIEEFKKKYNLTTKDEADVLGSYDPTNRKSKAGQVISSNLERMSTAKGLEGYQKYLYDEEVKKNGAQYDLNKDGKDSFWEKANRESLDILNDYNNRINKSEWLDEEDRKKYRKALDTYISTSNSLRGLNKALGEGYTDEDEQSWTDSIASMNKRYDDISSFYSQFSNDKEYNKWYTDYTKQQEYKSVLSAEDFDEYSKVGAGVANPDWKSAQEPLNILGWKPFGDGEDVVNMVTFAENNYEAARNDAIGGMRSGKVGQYTELVGLINAHMKDEEKAIYNYYIGKGETEKANEYLTYMTDILRQREAGVISTAFDDTALELAFSFGANVQSGAQGLGNALNLVTGKEGMETTTLQYATSEMNKDNKGVWKVANDLAGTTGNMMPAIAAGTIASAVAGPMAGKAVSSIVTGLSSAGNSYANMIEEGYGVDQARKYGIMVGAAEGGLSYLFSGISSIGGKATDNLISKAIDGIDNGIARFFVDFAISSSSEAIEEGAQSILDPIFKKIATGEDFEGIDWSEVAYSAMLGALSSGMLEGVPTGARTVSNIKNAKETYKNEAGVNLVYESIKNNPDNAYAQKMKSRLDAGKDLTGAQLYSLSESNERSLRTQDVAKMKTAAEARLNELGESGDVRKLADVIVKAQSGEKLTSSESNLLVNSKYGRRVSTELNPESVESGGYTSKWAESIGTKRINTEAYNRGITEVSEAATEPAKANAVTENATVKENSTEAKFDVSVAVKNAEGKTVNTEIQSVEVDGDKASFTLANGEKVGRDNVAFKSENQKAVADIAVDNVSIVKGFTNEAATAMIKGYDGNIDPDRYATAFELAYEMGTNGAPASKLTRAMNLGVSDKVAYTAYELGRQSAENVESVLKSVSENGIINKNISEAQNESGENVHLRNGSKRDGGKNTQRQVSRVEGGARQAESRGKVARIADSEAARIVNEGREVKVADLGILGGSKEQSVRVVDKANETSSMKEARKRAEARGHKVTFFTEDNLVIEDKSGKWISARAYIKGNHVFVRADHPLYTADQLMRHEIGHDMIASDEVDIKAVRERLLKTVGKENIDAVAEAYADAYAGTGMSAEEIWEECICDSLGDMNIFAGDEAIGTFLDQMLPEISSATSESKSANKTRGSPDGKASRNITYDDDGNVITLSERFNSEQEDIRYSRELDFIDFINENADGEEKKPLTNREILASALESAVQNDIERQKLNLYKQKIDLINSEEQKLLELRTKIKELSLAKGKRDTEAIKKLQSEANQTANRINTYDKQLLNLESTKALRGVLEREKALARKRAEQKGKEALNEYRERAAKAQRELMDRYQESRKRGVEGRNKTAMRHKIKDIVSELNTLLLKPTAKKHIKEELRKEVADALSAINMDTVDADERVAMYNDLIAKEKNPDVIAELTKTRDRIQLQGDNLKEKLNNLQSAYEKIKNTDDIELNLAYQEVIQNSIKAVTEKVGNTSIRNMTLEQLEAVYDLFSMIRKTIRDANKSFKEKKGQTIMQMAEAVNDQVRTVGGQPYKRNAISASLQRIGWTFLKPFVAFRTIGSITLTNMYKELRNGEDTFYGDVKDAQAFIEGQKEKHGYKSWDMKKTKTFTAKSGKSFDLTPLQMMSLYAYSKREQAHEHIIQGGIVFEDALLVEKNKAGIPIKYEVTTKDAFNLSEETFAEIANSLTAEQKAFVDEMQAYLSDTMGAKGNEVSMELLGVKLFKEKFYLPIKSSQYYMNFKAEEAGEVKLKSPAFSKETVKQANNPIVIHNFTDLWAEHINDMSMYHSFVLALEDFTRVYNYKTKTDAKVETMDTKATLETAYPGVTKYINKFLKDMNGGVRGETVGWAEKLTSLSKKGAVLGSASVTIQQPSAVMRAMAYINPKYFVTSAHKSINLLKHKQDFEELKKYAPIAGIKEMGRFDVGMGQGTVDWIKADKTVLDKAEDFLSMPPAFMDEVTWVTIWNAVKRETIHNNPKLSTSSEEFLKLCGERFTEVVSLSQVYDSVFSRSDIMRNKSWIAKALTAFMAEPTTTLNMMWDSWVQAKRSGSAKGYVKAITVTGGAITASIVLNAALKSIITAMRDDDDDESYVEKYLEHFVGDLKDSLNPLSLIPFVKDIVSIFKGYDVERMDMALFSDLQQAIDAMDSESKTTYEKWSGLVGALSAFFGVPVKNVERDVRGLITTVFGETEETTLEGMLNAIEEGWTGEEKSNGQQLYEAMLKGDSAQIKRIEGRFKDQTAINTAIRKALRENDPRIKEAAEARYNGDITVYMKIAKSIIAEGNFKQDDIVAAINSEVNALKPDEGGSTPSDKVVSLYKIEDYYAALVNGTSSVANTVKEDIIATDVANGKDRGEAEASFYSKFVNHIRDMYDEGEITDYKAKEMLVRYGDKTSEEAASKVQYWSFKKQYPDYDLSESSVSKYYSDVKPSGISVEVYFDYSKQRSKAEGVDLNGDGKTDSGSVKREVMEIINSLPISSYQKDALYFLNGWSKNTIYEAPWH